MASFSSMSKKVPKYDYISESEDADSTKKSVIVKRYYITTNNTYNNSNNTTTHNDNRVLHSDPTKSSGLVQNRDEKCDDKLDKKRERSSPVSPSMNHVAFKSKQKR